jgi:hypothetical protein
MGTKSFFCSALVLLLLTTASHAQQTPYYITDGDSQRLLIVQNGTIVSDTASFPLAYPMFATADGILILNRSGTEVREFNLDGTPTGNITTLPGTFEQLLDAASNGVNIFLARFGTSEILIANLDFSNIESLFGVPFGPSSVAYDPVRDELLVGVFGQSTLSRYTLTGSLIGTIPSPIGSAALHH